jgi:hypothetical protein
MRFSLPRSDRLPRVQDFDRFLFIVGAPRCGTTSLSHFLRSHPAVSFPAVKEPHFFAQHDLRGLSDAALTAKVEEDYLNRFYADDPSRRVGADASVTYLYTPEQLEPVLRLWPQSRFIVSVRDPLTMLPSLHQRLIYLGDETITDFAQAWKASADRAAGRRIPRGCADPRWLRYDEAARFGSYVERLYSVVGKDRCLVMTFDDFTANTEQQYRRFMDFAGLEPRPRANFEPRRSGYAIRHQWLQRLLKRPPNRVREYLAGQHFRQRLADPGKAEEETAQQAIWSIRKRLLRWNRENRPPEPVPLETQREIAAYYRDEVEHLARLIDRDLSHWLRPSAASAPAARPEANAYRQAYAAGR